MRTDCIYLNVILKRKTQSDIRMILISIIAIKREFEKLQGVM